MVVERIGEVGDRDSEGHIAGVFGTGFTVKSLAGEEPGIEIGSERS